mgnify:CR=1 FL=1
MNTQKWMEHVDGNKKLYEFTIPGTHDTGTWTLANGPAKCQKDSLEQQLSEGIRFIDIRLKPSGYQGDDDALMVWHGQYDCHLNFIDDIVKKCGAFLKANPTETIMMSVKNESATYPRSDVFYKKVTEAINAQGDLFYTGTSIPHLKDVRGKIVLLRRFTLDGRSPIGINLYDEWPDDKKINHWTSEGDSFYVQDEYTYFTIIDNKYYDYVRPTLDKALSSEFKNYLFLNFASCTGRLWPIDIANIVNKKVQDYPNSGRLGIVIMDAPDTNLIKKLIRDNVPPFQDMIYEKATVFPNENNGVWTMPIHQQSSPIFTGFSMPYLTYIKTSNTQSGKTEVHIASGNSNYQTRVLDVATTFDQETNGTWLTAYNSVFPGMPGLPNISSYPDLIFIKTANTPSGKTEVHIASGVSKYQTRILETETTFDCEDNGIWTMGDYTGAGILDLVFIKTKNTPSGKVEVHVASGASHYKTRILETATTFNCENDGTWTLTDWYGSGIPDLVYIKNKNTPSGNVEVHIASGASKYQSRVLECATVFKNENDGVWLMRSFRYNGIQDLVFIKTANTPNNHVEIHVASGTK